MHVHHCTRTQQVGHIFVSSGTGQYYGSSLTLWHSFPNSCCPRHIQNVPLQCADRGADGLPLQHVSACCQFLRWASIAELPQATFQAATAPVRKMPCMLARAPGELVSLPNTMYRSFEQSRQQVASSCSLCVVPCASTTPRHASICSRVINGLAQSVVLLTQYMASYM
jgi:hypothetical protein